MNDFPFIRPANVVVFTGDDVTCIGDVIVFTGDEVAFTRRAVAMAGDDPALTARRLARPALHVAAPHPANAPPTGVPANHLPKIQQPTRMADSMNSN